MTSQPTGDRVARAILTHLAEPADPLLAVLLQAAGPGGTLAAIRSGTVPAALAVSVDGHLAARLRSAVTGWQARLRDVPPDPVTGYAERGFRLICPGDPDWPAQLADLGPAQPYALWVRGSTELRSLCGKSVAIIGARAASGYGRHVATQFAVSLAADGWVIVSGAAYGIDAAAHHGALVTDGTTIAVLACGPDVAYPREHRGLLDDIARHGAVISEWPPGTRPARSRFLLRNRIIAALAAGTVVIEAAARSGTLGTAWHAEHLGRPLMAVPGPVTSAMSVGCHLLIRAGAATCVTSAAEVIQTLASSPGSGR